MDRIQNRCEICNLSDSVCFIIEIILLNESKISTYHINELKNIELKYPSIYKNYIKLNDMKSTFRCKQEVINHFVSTNSNYTFEFFYYIEDIELCINTMIKFIENNSLTILDAKCLEKILYYCSLTRHIEHFYQNICSIIKLIEKSKVLFITITLQQQLYFSDSFFVGLIVKYSNRYCKLVINAVDRSNALFRKNLLKCNFSNNFLSYLEQSYYC